MSNTPIIWKAGVMKDGAAYISFPNEQLSPKRSYSPGFGITQLDMTRDDVVALRDVLTAALEH